MSERPICPVCGGDKRYFGAHRGCRCVGTCEEYVALPVCACGWRSSILTICPTCKKPMTVVPVESMRSENVDV